MSFIGGSIQNRLRAYAHQRSITIADRLGFGKDGSVWMTSARSAVKVFEHPETYQQERSVYARLSAHKIDNLCGHRVPHILNADDPLAVLEMTIVSPPFLLDFASAQLDTPVEFPPEVMDQWLAEKRDQFGPHLPRVMAILHALERLGIFMLDVHPGNIRFAEPPAPINPWR